MEKRELYKQKYEAQVHEWTAKLDVLKARTEKLTAQAKLDVKPNVDAVHAKLDAARAKLGEVAAATDDKWDEFAKGVDAAWHDVKASVEGAYDAVTRHEKS